MSGTDPQRRGAGNGYVEEIARTLDHELRKRKNTRLMVVWVDYLGAMAKRHLEATDENYNDLRHRLSGAVLLMSTRVAKAFQCPVWINHQLSGEANSRGPTARMHHTDGAEAKNVAENADFAIVAGRVTDEQLCVFHCTKHRREPPRQSAVVHIDGQFSRIADVSNMYTVDRHGGEIINNEDAGLPHYQADYTPQNI